MAAGRQRGLGLYPAAPCALDPSPEALELVMGFARLTPDAVRAGVHALAGLLEAGPEGV